MASIQNINTRWSNNQNSSPVLFLLITSSASAEKYAFEVGVNDYQGDISPLCYYVTNVEAFRDTLVEIAGYKPENVHLMTDQSFRLAIITSRLRPKTIRYCEVRNFLIKIVTELYR